MGSDSPLMVKQTPPLTADSERFAMCSEQDYSSSSISSDSSSMDDYDEQLDLGSHPAWYGRDWYPQQVVPYTSSYTTFQPLSPPANRGHLPRSPASPDLSHLTDIGLAAGRGDQTTSPDQGDREPICPTSAESVVGTSEKTTMEKRESEEGKFSDRPLEVDKDVALSEENVELYIPNVLTQI